MCSCCLRAACFGAAGPSLADGKPFVTVLVSLDYSDSCWSSVLLQNLREKAVSVDVEAHESGGALLPIDGLAGNSLRLAAGQKVALRLQVKDSEGH